MNHDISRAALWDLLNGRGHPRWSTVAAFVAACVAVARMHRPPVRLAPEDIDLSVWHKRYTAAYPGSPSSGSGGPAIVPRQLPSAIPYLAGRRAQLHELNSLLKVVSAGTVRETSPTLMVTGTAGVGKTSLAVWWAWQAADEFCDGQIYVNLRGFEFDAQPMSPEQALHGFLTAFDVPPQRIPQELSAQSRLYRSMLAGRRVLVVLDNAHSAAQVAPLLPASPSCMVIITSRVDAASIDGAYRLHLDLLTRSEARQLLRDRLGSNRVAAEPEAVDAIIDMCARLPLALAVVAARATVAPGTLGAVAAELTLIPGRLDAMSVDNESGGDVRGALSWSYRALSPAAANLFRLLGLHPGPEIDAHAVASLVGITSDQAKSLVAELACANLISEPTLHRYNLHDLLREYAAELVTADGEAANRQAVLRLVNHYLAVAHVADRLMDSHRDDRTRLVEPEPPANLEPPRDVERAHSWFRTEHRVLVNAVKLALREGLAAHAWQLAWTITTYLDRDGHWHDWATVMTNAVEAADQLGHQSAQAIAHRILGHALVLQDRLDEAVVHLEHSLRLFHELGDLASEAATHNSIGGICDLQGRYQEALDHALVARNLFEAANDAIGRAHAFNSVGWCQARLGQLDLALMSCRQSLSLLTEIGDQYRQAVAWDSIGYINHLMGKHRTAIECYGNALALFLSTGERYYLAESLTHQGDCHRDLEELAEAREAWRQALIVLDELGRPEAEAIRDKLVDIDEQP